MKLYMPAPHRAFLDHLAKVANIRPFVLETVSAHASPIVQDVTCVYNSYVHQIKLFRDNHIQIVTRYTMTQAKQGLPQGSEDNRVQVEVNKEDEKQKAEELMNEKTQIRGIPKVDVGEPVIKRTGGSDLMLFLKHNRDEMNAAKVQSAVK